MCVPTASCRLPFFSSPLHFIAWQYKNIIFFLPPRIPEHIQIIHLHAASHLPTWPQKRWHKGTWDFFPFFSAKTLSRSRRRRRNSNSIASLIVFSVCYPLVIIFPYASHEPLLPKHFHFSRRMQTENVTGQCNCHQHSHGINQQCSFSLDASWVMKSQGFKERLKHAVVVPSLRPDA